MDDKLIDLGKRIDECFTYLKANVSLDELAEFEQYVEKQETLMPLLQTIAYINNGSLALDFAKQRVESLKNLLETEEKLLKEVKFKR